MLLIVWVSAIFFSHATFASSLFFPFNVLRGCRVFFFRTLCCCSCKRSSSRYAQNNFSGLTLCGSSGNCHIPRWGLMFSWGICMTFPNTTRCQISHHLPPSAKITRLAQQWNRLPRGLDTDNSLLVVVHTIALTARLYVIISHRFRGMYHWYEDQEWRTGF